MPCSRTPASRSSTAADHARLLAEVRACRICIERPTQRRPLPHAPRPVLVAEPTARLLVCGQAPGTRVHASGQPFDDASGDRLRDWMGIDRATFYDARRIAFLPMGLCFPGQDAKGGDLPPRRECAPEWRARLMAALPRIALVLLVGQYAQAWHLGDRAGTSLTDTVTRWRDYARPVADAPTSHPAMIPLPHPSWRNTGWIKRHPWFAAELLPHLRREVRRVLAA